MILHLRDHDEGFALSQGEPGSCSSRASSTDLVAEYVMSSSYAVLTSWRLGFGFPVVLEFSGVIPHKWC